MADEEILRTYFEDLYDKMVSGSDTEEGKTALEQTKLDVTGQAEEVELQQELADAAWEQQMLEDIKKSDAEDQAKVPQALDPNLTKVESITKEFNDIPDFD
jgi:hypothetical protein